MTPSGIAAVIASIGLVAGAGCKKREEVLATRDAKPAARPSAPSFRRDVLPVLVLRCASAKGCHGDEPTESVDLDLRAEAAHAQLAGIPAEARPTALRVQPGDPRASFLVDKLSGALGPKEGKPMPIDADSGAPLVPSPLPQDFVEKVLVPWIAAGAPDN